MIIEIPLGAQLAAERAYANMPSADRVDPARVAEVVLVAAVPFLGPAVGRLGRTRITGTGPTDIFRHWLNGMTYGDIASLYGVSDTTIRNYVIRGVDRNRRRIAAGTPDSVIACENGVTRTALLAALDLVGTRHGA